MFFRKHTEILTPTGSLRIRIVDVRAGMIAFYDLNKSVSTRRSSSGEPKQNRLSRIQHKPESMDIYEFAESIENYQYEIRSTEYNNGLYVPKHKSAMAQMDIREERKAEARFKFDVIKTIVENDDNLYEYLYTSRGNQLINQISRETGISAAQISRWLAQYFYKGGCFNALFPDYRNCGANFQLPEKTALDQVKRGRPSADSAFRNRTLEDERKIDEHLKKLGRKEFNRLQHTKQYRIFDYYYQTTERKCCCA